MAMYYKIEAAELDAILHGAHIITQREKAILQILARVGAHVLTASALDYNGNAEASMGEEIYHAARNQGWLNPLDPSNLPYYLALAEVLKLDPADYGIEPDPLAFHDPARTPVERDVLREDMSNAYREYLAAGTDCIDRLHALQIFTDKLADYAGVEVVAP